jgi:hypothetical protein
MGERKVLNRYIPPDFDPSIIPKFKREKGRLIEVRMMLPFSLRCNTCGEYMYRGKKFNSKSERVQGEDYMGITKLRFYIKCTNCSAEITFKTDPKNTDYECESGASRNFELWRDNTNELEQEAKEREEEEDMDAMKALEHRTIDNKIEMDVLDALDEIKALNYRHQKVDTAKILEQLDKSKKAKNGPVAVVNDGLTKEDEELLKSIKFRNSKTSLPSSQLSFNSNFSTDQALNSTYDNGTLAQSSSSLAGNLSKQVQNQLKPTETIAPIIIKKRKNDIMENQDPDKKRVAVFPDKIQKVEPVANVQDKPTGAVTTDGQDRKASLSSLLMGYGDDDDNDEVEE